MAKNTLIQKILDRHIVSGEKSAGAPVAIRIDQTLTQDATGTMAYLELEAMGVKKVATELSVSYVDHNMMQNGPENRNDHLYLQSVAASKGVLFSRPGNGICHQVHLERYGVPGKTLLGSDSHTPTGGGIGMMAIGAGGLDVALAMAGQPFRLAFPKIIGVELTGKLRNWVSAKDIILKMLEILSTKGNVGCMVEYFGEGVGTLTVPQRATITNMGAELGVTCSIFPSDAMTREFLAAQGREADWIPLAADPDAEYDRVVKINLNELEELAACPSSPDNIKTIASLEGTKVGQVIIGSCTNSSYRDLMLVAGMLKGRKISEDVTLAIRTPEASMAASRVSAVPEVRARLVRLQQETARGIAMVMDGRDIGTKVLPDAELKIYLTASCEARALRRYAELRSRGECPAYHAVLDDIVERDYNDSHRAASPLCRAADARLLDTSDMTLAQVIDAAVALAHAAGIEG